MATERLRSHREGPAPQKAALPVEQIAPLYPNEWVLVRIVKPGGTPGALAQVIAHDPSRKKVSKVLIQLHLDEPAAHTSLFYGGQRARNAATWRNQLAEAARNPL